MFDLRRRLVTAYLWRAEEDKGPTARRSVTNDREDEGNPNPQRVAQEGDKEKDVVRANLGELDKEQDGLSGCALEQKNSINGPPGWPSPDDRKWL